MSGYLRDIIWRNKNMSLKIGIYETCIRPLMTYALKQEQKQSLNIDITVRQAHWIKYRTWSYKKKKKRGDKIKCTST
jgi:hypothetical protein